MLLTILETVINRALQADTDALAKIGALENQVIEVCCDDWRMHFYITPTSRGLHFHSNYSGQVNTTIRGTLNNFLHIFISGGNTKALFHYPIDIEGNTHTIEVLRDAFKNLTIDFEEKLSHYLGDGVAHKLCFHLKNTKDVIKDSGKKMLSQTKEYLHYESKNGISKKQADQFYADIAKLRDDVDRAEARMNQLKTRRVEK